MHKLFHVQTRVSTPLSGQVVEAGFPSPAEGAATERLSLDEVVITHPEATFFMRMKSDALVSLGIFTGDLVVVDRSVAPRPGKVVVLFYEGEWLVRRLSQRVGGWCLESDEGLQIIDEDIEIHVWGVVTHTVHTLK